MLELLSLNLCITLETQDICSTLYLFSLFSYCSVFVFIILQLIENQLIAIIICVCSQIININIISNKIC